MDKSTIAKIIGGVLLPPLGQVLEGQAIRKHKEDWMMRNFQIESLLNAAAQGRIPESSRPEFIQTLNGLIGGKDGKKNSLVQGEKQQSVGERLAAVTDLLSQASKQNPQAMQPEQSGIQHQPANAQPQTEQVGTPGSVTPQYPKQIPPVPQVGAQQQRPAAGIPQVPALRSAPNFASVMGQSLSIPQVKEQEGRAVVEQQLDRLKREGKITSDQQFEDRRREFDERRKEGQEVLGLKGIPLANYVAGRNLMTGMNTKPLFGVNVPGTALPQNAMDLDGNPISPDARKQARLFRPIAAGVDDEGNPQYRYQEVAPTKSGASPTQFQQWMNSQQEKKGKPLTPDEVQKAITQYAKLHHQSPAQIYQNEKEREKAKIDVANEYPQLTTSGQTAIANVDPTIGQIDDLLSELEKTDENGVPYKDNNTNLYFTKNRLKYAAGIAPEEGNLAGQIANLELVKITGALPYATKSRNFNYIKQIQQHLPNAWVDSPMNVYQKLQVAKENMERIKQDVLENDVKGKVVGGGAAGGPLPPPPKPRGASSTVKMKTPDGKTWDVPSDKVKAAEARGATRVQ